MLPLDIVRLQKAVATSGGWKVTTGVSKMPPSAYPMSKRASFRLGRGWHWRVDVLTANGLTMRLMTAFSTDHEEFLAWLSTEEEDGLRVIARYEFHGTHPDWHYHTASCDYEKIPVGDPRPRLFERKLDPNDPSEDFIQTENDALAKSFGFFNVTAPPEDALL